MKESGIYFVEFLADAIQGEEIEISSNILKIQSNMALV